MNEAPQQTPAPRRTDRIATHIGRVFACCVGGGLLVTAIVLKVWIKSDLKELMKFAAVIGLCLGYGLGGDIWGARVFDLFAGHNSEKDAGKPVHPFMQKAMLFSLIGLLVFVVAVWVAVLLC